MLRTLNLGILAHVDAGKTTLSERLLFEAGVIGQVGSVDDGTTQTDSLALERQRGITIRSAVVSLAIKDTSINLIDTPGHPDFIAEVDRVLGVLDGAVLVISAVEGVQPQTRVLMRALRRMRVPTMMFINKIDRRGADVDRVLGQIRRRLGVTAVRPDLDEPTTLIEVLAGQDDSLLRAYVEDEPSLTPARLREELVKQTHLANVCPVFVGSALTGLGVEALMDGLIEFLPAGTGDATAPVSGSVFKIERGEAGEKICYVRMFSGTLHVRERLREDADKVTAINVFADGLWARRDAVRAGEIGKLWGLGETRVGDHVGRAATHLMATHFAPPALEAIVYPLRTDHHVALRSALKQLAEQDPLINVRVLDGDNDVAVSLYGEVQKEVIQATLANEYGIDVAFRETTTLYLERPAGTGEALELLNADGNPFRATIGLRVEPAAPDYGVEFRLRVDYRTVPLFVYRNVEEFASSMERYVRDALTQGLHGWPVSDCVVTMVKSNYSSPDGPPATRGPLSTAADFRKLTPIVVRRALQAARTQVCEPMSRVRVEFPDASLGSVLSALNRLGAVVEGQSQGHTDVIVEAVLPAAKVSDLHRALPGLTSGEGALESTFAGYRAITRR